ncbi:MFS transporter [Pullulanibacillus camelliae]|uniref:MFS transporter n=1 Tax=Pullulanibacillus camelliae TaxID=1707096 RepID=A0A8J2VMV3_9BACL|nr:MFS transporter [Pullulanibacillus camelliae]GGE32870.1 MFS transporter [Pullulanibacillus camelliae]
MLRSKKVGGAADNAFDRKLIAPMVLGSILNPINSSIISVALLPIGQAFGAPPSQTAWLVSALYLATALGQPVVGKLIDLFGPKLLFMIATSLVGISGVVAIFAPNLWWLVAARVLLGLGTCAGYPASMYIIRREAERTGEESPTSILTILAIANQTIAVIGPTLGGLLIDIGGWQSTFIINIPLSIACILLGIFRLPRQSRFAHEEKKLISIDLIGMLLFGITLISALLFLMNPSVSTLYLLGIAIIIAIIFAVFELKISNPFIDIRVLGGNTPLLLTFARSLLAAIVAYCFLYGFPQWLEKGRGLSPSHAGLLLLPMFLTAIIVSRTTGKSPAIRLKLIVGSIVQFIAMSLILLTNHTSSILFLIILILLLGIPQGLLNLANQNAVFFQADPKQIGASAGLLRTFMYLGAILASAANGLFLKSGATTAGMHHIAMFSSVIGILLIAITLFDRRLKTAPNKKTA